MIIYNPVSSLKGVGPKSCEVLNRAGIFTIIDLLLYFPRDYEFVNGNIDTENINEEEKSILRCRVLSHKGNVRTRTGKNLTTIEFAYGENRVIGKWFNQPYVRNTFHVGKSYNLMGKFKKVGNVIEITNPSLAGEEALKSEIIPKYPLKGNLSDKMLVKLISHILDNIKIEENMPKYLLDKYNMDGLDNAIREIHFPKTQETLKNAKIRLKFQELFSYSMKLLLLKEQIKGKADGIVFNWHEDLTTLKESLPYKLTNAQTKVVRDILRDQKSPYAMNRLVQGDVGSGKTVVSLIAIFNVIRNGYKAALMVPTEILANQHYEEGRKLLGEFGVHFELLTGSTSTKEKKRIKELIKGDEPVVVVGTHALIQEDVEFNKLGLVVTDEQHRFGVEQRSKLINKGARADCLVMTATPIPRTLALYVYSDLDISAIDELPPGRKKIQTQFYKDNKRERAYLLAREQVLEGRQVYIVCPLIDEDEKNELNSVEKVYNDVSQGVFEGIKVEILHGKMKPAEKDEIINRFKGGETKVLISTTVIEVGVNVPNASVMIIENAERFGLAQLHQLRGRVGRGGYESYCILIANAKSKNTEKRMEIMVESTDGFYISEQDLKLRGAGEMFGMRQSGDEGLILSDIYEDMDILRCARGEAKMILEEKNEENIRIVNEVKKNLQRSTKYICFN
ncbi:MAG: ATP-dependent DNA helicase RecG [Clostridium sp.]